MFVQYNRIFLTAIALWAAIVGLIALNQEPLEGDLTRTGAISEKQFGWQGSQEYFKESFLFKVGYSLEDLDEPYDVIVLGDSFTRREGNSWASYLADKTGWKIIGFHHRDITAKALMDSVQFRANPSPLIVYQTVERHAERRLAELRGLTPPTELFTTQHPLPIPRPMHAPVEVRQRPDRFADFNDRMGVGVHFLKTWLRSLLSGQQHARALALRADAPPLFSSRSKDSVLLLNDDFELRKQWLGKADKAIAGFQNAERIFASGGANMVLMVFPDKLTVYADYLQDPQWQGTSVVPEFGSHLTMPRLDLVYADALAKGTIDLYAPNNTHTSSLGSRLAAEAFLEFVEGARLVRDERTIADTSDI